jgi:hypothetical protein
MNNIDKNLAILTKRKRGKTQIHQIIIAQRDITTAVMMLIRE